METKTKASICYEQGNGDFSLNPKPLKLLIVAASLIFLMSLAFKITCLSWEESKYTDPARKIVVPDDFTKIQNAIDNATPGDTVYVRAGVYTERLLINKSILLMGENNATTVIESSQHEDTITVMADNVTVSGFTVKSGENFTLSYGIRLSNSHNTTISDNIITGHFEGVGLVGGSSNLIQYNLITKNRYGIFTSNFSTNNVIFHNLVSESIWNGIELNWGGGNIVYANNIVNNTAYGLEIPVYAPSLNNIILHNDFVNNVHTVIEGAQIVYQAYGPSPNFWDNDGEGNYWSDYMGKDEDHDGIGDSPHVTMYGTADHYPLMGDFSDIMIRGFCVTMVSNSLITGSDLRLNGTKATLSMSIFQKANSTGFCRVSLPKALMADPYEVRFDGVVITYPQVRELPCSNRIYECLYVDYPPGDHSIEISGIAVVSEFPMPMVFVFFGPAVILAFMLYRRRH
jgi:parallel beta-helix repeat protein